MCYPYRYMIYKYQIILLQHYNTVSFYYFHLPISCKSVSRFYCIFSGFYTFKRVDEDAPPSEVVPHPDTYVSFQSTISSIYTQCVLVTMYWQNHGVKIAFATFLKNRQLLSISQKPPVIIYFSKNRKLLSFSQKPPVIICFSKTASYYQFLKNRQLLSISQEKSPSLELWFASTYLVGCKNNIRTNSKYFSYIHLKI